MANFAIRAEDIDREELLRVYVETAKDKQAVELLKSATPVILEGSRGTGKTFLLRVAEAQLLGEFRQRRVLPVYVSFLRSSLLQSSDPNQFTNWMMARLCGRIVRTLYQLGLLAGPLRPLSLLTGEDTPVDPKATRLERVAAQYEESYLNPGKAIDAVAIPTVQDCKGAVEDICRSRGIERIALFFDKAAHIIRPDQQRQFFTLFRELRSPYLSCRAAVYPGATSGGPGFPAAPAATVVALSRDLLEGGYLGAMREMVLRQADATLAADLRRNRENLDALAWAASGNPRFLLKTVAQAQHLSSGEVARALRGFYRNDIWSEHFGLAGGYPVHRALMEWGREYIEETVIPDLMARNEQWAREGKSDSTCCFCVHGEAPAGVTQSLRLLGYKGIVTRLDSGMSATRSEVGTWYALNLGCLASASARPISTLTSLGRTLNRDRFIEYGPNHARFAPLAAVGQLEAVDLTAALASELAKPIEVLDLTDSQKRGLHSVGLDTVGKALQGSDRQLQKLYYVGPKKSQKMLNVVVASVHEYLSG
jgi:hypothetical protein